VVICEWNLSQLLVYLGTYLMLGEVEDLKNRAQALIALDFLILAAVIVMWSVLHTTVRAQWFYVLCAVVMFGRAVFWGVTYSRVKHVH